jgi:hypothetical protein
LFYQAEFILKKKGLLVVCIQKDDLIMKESEKKHFVLKAKHSIFSGQQEYHVLVFAKGKNRAI